jgi:hypothetical protein
MKICEVILGRESGLISAAEVGDGARHRMLF